MICLPERVASRIDLLEGLFEPSHLPKNMAPHGALPRDVALDGLASAILLQSLLNLLEGSIQIALEHLERSLAKPPLCPVDHVVGVHHLLVVGLSRIEIGLKYCDGGQLRGTDYEIGLPVQSEVIVLGTGIRRRMTDQDVPHRVVGIRFVRLQTDIASST